MTPERDLDVQWRPISLLFKNDPPKDSDYYEPVFASHRLLRVMESARAGAETPEAGNDAVFRLYRQAGTWIHQDGRTDFTASELVDAAGVDDSHASAYDDDAWDTAIRDAMDDGLSLVGTDVGTPILAMRRSDGERSGYFGPVINRLPDSTDALAMWDALVTMMDVDVFFELKRTRTGDLDFGARPDLV